MGGGGRGAGRGGGDNMLLLAHELHFTHTHTHTHTHPYTSCYMCADWLSLHVKLCDCNPSALLYFILLPLSHSFIQQ